MITLRNRKDLNENLTKINKSIVSSLELDLDSISEFDDVDIYGSPLIILYDEIEENNVKKSFSVLEKIEPEDEEIVYKSMDITIYRTCYLLTDGGFILYKRIKNV